MKNLLLTLTLAFSFILGYGQYDLSKNVERQVIVVPNQKMDDLTTSFIEANNAEIIAEFDQLGWYVVLLPENITQDKFISICKDFSFIKNVWKDEIMTMQRHYIPNDTQFATQWFLKQSNDKDIDADEAWDLLPSTNPFVSVAMFDGGLDLTHPDLIGNTDSPFNAVNLTNSVPYVNSEDKHGTACSGTIAALTNNGIGVSSVGNNKVKVMPVNIMSQVFAGGSFNTTNVIQVAGINAAMANPNCVAIAMSYGGSGFSSALEAAFLSARTTARGGKGMCVFASSGNNYSGTAAQYPANYSNVWGVGATTSSDVRASFSNYGPICDISAPGSGIGTTDRIGTAGYNTTDYTSISGTSFSCPITAAASAVIFYKNWTLTDDEVLNILSQSCEKVGGYVYSTANGYPYGTRSNELGYGRINLKNAVNLTPTPGGTPPPPPPSQHNFYVQNVTVSPSSLNMGGTITITCNQSTTDGTLSVVNPILQYRSSVNTIWGDSDDVIIGTDTTTLGGGVSTGVESITYVTPLSVGTRYILIMANHNNVVTESSPFDNSGQASYVLIDPNVALTDLAISFNLPTTSVVNLTPTQILFNYRPKITNTGSAIITSFAIGRKWMTCPGTLTNCETTENWSGTLLPGQSVYLPNGQNSSWSTQVCFSSTSCAIPPGGTNTFSLRLISVNTLSTDINTTNNIATVVVNRVTTATTNDVEFVEVRNFSKLYENPIRYNSIDDAILEKGLNFIYIHYDDGTVEIMKISRN